MVRPLLPLLVSILLAGCSPSIPPDSPEAGPDKLRIALIMKSLANEFFKSMEESARRHEERHSSEYELIASGIKDELDVSRQIALFEQMMAQRVDAVVIAPADSKSLVSVCKRALDQEIVVVNIDNRLDQQVLAERNMDIPFVGPDNRKGARLAGQFLAQRLNRGDHVAIIEGVPSAYNAIQRKQGFEDAMERAGMRIVASQSANWEMSQAHEVVSALVNEHPKLRGILCSNDSMALGAVASLKSANKLDQISVIGFDNIRAVRELIAQGQVLATVDQHADQLAVFGIQYALEMLRSDHMPEDRETPVDLITAANLKR